MRGVLIKFILFVAVATLSQPTYGKNDWTTACLDGTCSYDVEKSSFSMAGTIEISGSPSAVSDITSAAGWKILNCSDSTNTQTIRLICTDESMGCQHIFQDGAQDTIVRLPEDCGSGPFVRVANHWILDDQPTLSRMSNQTGDSGALQQIHILQIDDDFAKGSGIHGDVSFEILAEGDVRTSAKRGKRQNGSGFVPDSFSIPAFTLIELFNHSLTCTIFQSPADLGLSGFVDLVDISFNVTVNVISRGTLSPPNITSLSFSTPTNATLDGSVQLTVSLQGTVSVIDARLANMTFPPFIIDGIVSINPSFVVSANVIGLAQLQSLWETDNAYTFDINNLQFTYPSNNPPATVNVSTPSFIRAIASTLPAQNALAQFAFTTIFELLVEVSAFTQFVDLSVTYEVEHDFGLESTPSTGNNEEVCFNATRNFTVQVANSGPFFHVFEGADFLTIFENETSLFSVCQDVPLESSPPVPSATPSPLVNRGVDVETFSCPPDAAFPPKVLLFSHRRPSPS